MFSGYVHTPFLHTLLHQIFIIPAARSGQDYQGVSIDLVFTAGASNGAMQCIGVAIVDSPTVEEDETFTVILTISNVDVDLGNDMTAVTITDINSM